jgi:valyl-tRNA synthetase
MVNAEYTAYVKGDPAANKLADCPFCQRVLLTLEVKSIPYKLGYIDFAAKPEWLQEKSGGKVPVINQGDFWLPDSDEIVKYLEKEVPTPSMASSVPADVTGSLFGAFRGFLTAQGDEEAAKKEAFLAELSKINAYLAQHGPLFGGQALNETDAATAPKLYHATVALGHFKGWKLDAAQFPAVAAYMEKLKGMPAWQHTLPADGDAAVVAGWVKHMSS